MQFDQPYPSQRAPVMGDGMVATSQPLAAQAGLDALAAGGNAIDAALTAAMVLPVVEPTGTGLGSDAFALIYDGETLHGLNASGRAPAAWHPGRFAGHATMPQRGWETVTVPGAVSGWAALAERFAALPLTRLAEPAIHYAEDGFPVSPNVARLWARDAGKLADQPGFAATFLPDGRAPAPGQRFRSPAMAASLRAIAESGGESFYRGHLAERIAAAAFANGAALTADDLAAHRPDWVTPMAQPYGKSVLHELPPNGQGIAAQIALGLLARTEIAEVGVDSVAGLHLQFEAMKLALADAAAYVGDPAHMTVAESHLLDPAYLETRAASIDRRTAGDPGAGAPAGSDTIYLCTADSAGRMVSFIQSNYFGFGSGAVVPETGISLQSRGAGFVLTPGHPNQVGGGKRPFHTIIPGFLTAPEGQAQSAFGVMGGPIQTQGHVQMVLRREMADQNPQTCCDAPRWRVLGGREVALESGWDAATRDGLAALGHAITLAPPDDAFSFGGAQMIARAGGSYVGGSDPRKDGQAVAR